MTYYTVCDALPPHIVSGGFMIFDSHVHLTECLNFFDESELFPSEDYAALSFVFSNEELNLLKDLKERSSKKILCAAAVHPLCCKNPDFSFIEDALYKNELDCIGETGFDFFDDKKRSLLEDQKKSFSYCLSLALKHKKGVSIHERRALDMIFPYMSELKKLPFVIFHGFSHTAVEAESLLKKGLNAYFSFGKNLLKEGNRKNIDCIKKLPLERIFLETDAPFMTLKNQKASSPSEILDVYKKCAELLNIPLKELEASLYENYLYCFEFLKTSTM